MKKWIPVLTLVLLLFSCKTANNNARKEKNNDPVLHVHKQVLAENGAVVSAHTLASKAGLDILKKGGNAVDAAIATQLALAVVCPNAGNLGGGGFMVTRLASGEIITIDFREKAPARAGRDMYIDANGNARTDKSQEGHLASGIPGSVAGIFAAMKYAKLPFATLIEPAILLAEKGFVISDSEAVSFNKLQNDLAKFNTVMPVFFKPSGWKKNDTLVQTDLANTLIRIRDHGAKGFYEGETARLIVEEMKRGGGLVNYDDLKNYQVVFRKPHIFYYKNYTIAGMPMPSSGGLLLNQMMKMIETRDIASMGFHSPQAVQLMAEVERRAFADRGLYMGDADFYKVPVTSLTNDAYLASRMKDYDPAKAGNSTKTQPGLIPHESEETTHFNVADKAGNVVAVTTTLNDSYGAKTVVGGAGFFLNDEMDDFSIKPGVPNMYGAIGGDANAIEPGKRMLSSMTPTIVLRDNKPYLVIGTPGGTTIPTSVFQTIVNLVEFNMSVEDAVYKPKFHHQWLPDSIDIEKGFPVSTREALEKMGYRLNEKTSIGRTEVIRFRPDGKMEAVADIRGEDDAEGW